MCIRDSPSDPVKGKDKPCRDCKKDKRHHDDGNIAHGNILLTGDGERDGSEAFRLDERVEKIGEQPDGADGGEADDKKMAHGCSL